MALPAQSRRQAVAGWLIGAVAACGVGLWLTIFVRKEGGDQVVAFVIGVLVCAIALWFVVPCAKILKGNPWARNAAIISFSMASIASLIAVIDAIRRSLRRCPFVPRRSASSVPC